MIVARKKSPLDLRVLDRFLMKQFIQSIRYPIDSHVCIQYVIIYYSFSTVFLHMGMDQYLLIPFLMGWTSIYQLFWCSPGVQGFDTLPIYFIVFSEKIPMISPWNMVEVWAKNLPSDPGAQEKRYLVEQQKARKLVAWLLGGTILTNILIYIHI